MKRATSVAMTTDTIPVAPTMYICVRRSCIQSGRISSGISPPKRSSRPKLTIIMSIGGSTAVTKNVAPRRTRIGTRTTASRSSRPSGKKSGMSRRE